MLLTSLNLAQHSLFYLKLTTKKHARSVINSIFSRLTILGGDAALVLLLLQLLSLTS